MAEFSYSDDIAPMKGNYFGRPISTHMSQYLYEEYDRPLMQMLAEDRRMQAQELAFQRAQFEFEKAKEESRRQQEEADAISRVSATLSEGLNSDMDSLSKVSFINQTRQDVFTQNPRLAGSPMFNSLFNSAAQSVTGADAQKNFYTTQMNATASLGDVGATEQLADMDGIRTPKELGIIQVAKAQDKANRARTQTGILAKRQQAELKAVDDAIRTVRVLGSEVEPTPEQIEAGDYATKFRLNESERLAQDSAMRQNFTAKEYEEYAKGTYTSPAQKKQFVLDMLMQKQRALSVGNAPTSQDDAEEGRSLIKK